MLILTRKTDEQILIGDDIRITLVRVRGNSVRIGIDAPREIRVVRSELAKRESTSAEANANDPIHRTTTPHMFVGRVSTERALSKRDRTPLSGFVSAT